MTRTPPHPDDVLLSLAHVVVSGGRTVYLAADSAQSDRRLLTLSLTPEQFAELLAAKVITVRSETAVELPPLVQYPPVRWVNVTLHGTTNRYLQLPCDGQLQIVEHGTDGSIISAIFRRRGDDGVLSAPVEIPHPRFTYADPRSAPPPVPAAKPANLGSVCGEFGDGGYRCGMWDHVAHTRHVFTIPPPQIAVIPCEEALTAEDARKLAGVPFPYLGMWRVAGGDPTVLVHVFSSLSAQAVHVHGYVPVGKTTAAR